MCPIAHSSFYWVIKWLVLSCQLEEELLVEDRCENLRSKISKIPRRSLISRVEIHRASDAELHWEAFHIRDQCF